ncbi:uncharacterized protein LOC121861075 [Homarus americanus]|uniref:uncharacterized protein LOC121861075 n=1 Tax=Homarus americanus TaxID=6706 RepID=UPI001C493E3F|nr:uncharacterized protein LOC121861075 [Homarus americanus]
MADYDPTSLRNVLNALKNSEKLKHWDKPPRDFGPDNPEDSDYNRNGLKDVGDLSNITISPGCSFIFDVDSEEDPEPKSAKFGTSCDIYNVSMEPEEELPEVSRCNSLVIAQRAQEQCRTLQQIEVMSLEEENRYIIYKNSKARREDYMRKLSSIQIKYDKDIEQYYHDRDEKLKLEEHRLRQQEEDASLAVKQCSKFPLEYHLLLS